MALQKYILVIAEGGPKDGQKLCTRKLEDGVLSVGRAVGSAIEITGGESAVGQHHCDLEVRDETVWLLPRPHQETYVDVDTVGAERTRPVLTPTQLLPAGSRTSALVELGGPARLKGRPAFTFTQTSLRVEITTKPGARIMTAQKGRLKKNHDNAKLEKGAITTAVVTFLSSALALIVVGGFFAIPAAARMMEEIGLVKASIDKVDRRFVEGLGSVITTLGRQHGQTIDILASLPEKLNQPRPGYYDRVMPSVWLVGVVDDAGAFDGVGTAWSIAGPGQQRPGLITNKHVVNILLSRRLLGRPAIRRFDDRAGLVQLMIDGAALLKPEYVHPHFSSLDALAATSPGTLVVNVADIARLQLMDPTQDTLLGSGLQLANPDSVTALKEAEIVGYIGYPFENLEAGAPNIEEPRPMFISGTIARLSGPMKAAGDMKDRQLLVLDAVAAGGASGSPLFNADGDVVGVIAGGDVLHLDSAVMRGSVGELSELSNADLRVPVGFTYAIRSDVVRELVEGRVDAERPERWRHALSAVGDEARQASRDLEDWKDRSCKGARPNRVTLSGDLKIPANGVFEYRAPSGTDKDDSYYFAIRAIDAGRLGEAKLLLRANEHLAPTGEATELRASSSALVGKSADIRLAVTGVPGTAIIVDQYACPGSFLAPEVMK